VAGIILGNADNDFCAVGIAHRATFSACNFFSDDVPYSALAYKLEAFDISQNSVGIPACVSATETGGEKQQAQSPTTTTECPFEHSDESEDNPCAACSGEFVEDQALSTQCEDAIANHCKNYYKADRDACSDFPEIIIGGDCDFDKLPQTAIDAIRLGIQQGRGGKGTIFVFASGNEFQSGDDINFSGWSNSRYTIAVGAVGKDGFHADYSTQGAGLMVSAPGGSQEDVGHLMTAGLGTETCVDSGQGTSFACPVVSGVLALVLEANPDLSWRDAQGLLAQSSRIVDNDEQDDTQTVSGGGQWHSNWYGFGVVDAKAAVEAALTWEPYSEELQAIGISPQENKALSSSPESPPDVFSIDLAPTADGYPDDFVAESTVVLLDLSHYSRGDLEVELVSPSQTKSVLVPGKRPENTQLEGDERWKLMTLKNWGEDPTGTWRLKIRDLVDNNENEGASDANIFRQWKLIVYGRSASGQAGFGGGDDDDTGIELTSDGKSKYCLDPRARYDCALNGQGQSVCPAGSQIINGDDVVTIDGKIVCPADITIGQDIFYTEASQRGLCSCIAGRYDNDCDVVEEDLECECFACPPESTVSVSYSCNKFIIGECTSLDCDGLCNGAYLPPLIDEPFVTRDPTKEPTAPPTAPPTTPPLSESPTKATIVNQQDDTTEDSDTEIDSEKIEEPPSTQPFTSLFPSGFGYPSSGPVIIVSPPQNAAAPTPVAGETNEKTEDAVETEGSSCVAAKPVESSSTNTGVITSSSAIDVDESCLVGLETIAGWYEVTGNGNVYTLRACSFDSSSSISITIFTGECSGLTCLGTQSRQVADCQNGYATSWVTESGKKYSVLVAGLPVGIEPVLSTGGVDPVVPTRRQLQPVPGKSVFKLDFFEEEVPANNVCGQSTAITSETTAEGITVGGDSATLYNTCEETEKTGVWYSVSEGTPSEDGVIVYEANTCNSKTNFYNTMSVFRGSNCDSLECVNVDVLPCKDGKYGQRIYWSTAREENYQIFVHAADSIEAKTYGAGSYSMEFSYNDRLANDQCSSVVNIALGEEIIGSTEGAKPDMSSISDSSCGTGSAGAWYRIVGTGGVFHASTCSNSTNHKTSIYVYSGVCGGLTCIDEEGANESRCSDLDATTEAAAVNFKTQEDVLYYVLVTGLEENGKASGTFGMTVTEVTPSPGNECSKAQSFSLADPSAVGNTLEATVDFKNNDVCGVPLNTPGVWYTIEGTGKGVEFSTCESNNYNTAISIFKGSCEDLECITGTQAKDPKCDNKGVTAAFHSEAGSTYYIYVHGTESSNNIGDFKLTYEEFDVIESNEFCPKANSILPDGSRVQGSTQDATHTALQELSCGVEITNPGLWYTFKGTGQPFTIAACNQDVEAFNVSVSVFTGGCENLKCITGATFFESYCSSFPTENLGNNFRFMTENLNDYHIFVHGQAGVGDFDLFVRDENLSNFGTASPTETPIMYGTDLYRWTIVGHEITIVTDYQSLKIVVASNGAIAVEGPTVKYVPPADFLGEDIMTLDGCIQGNCYRFDIIVSVMGDEQDLIRSEGGDVGDGKGGNMLYWLVPLLVLVILGCACIPIYIWYKKKQNEENDGDDDDSDDNSGSDGSEDDFTDDDEDGKLISNNKRSVKFANDDDDWESSESGDDDDDDSDEGSDEYSDNEEENDEEDSSDDDDDDDTDKDNADEEFDDFLDEFNKS